MINPTEAAVGCILSLAVSPLLVRLAGFIPNRMIAAWNDEVRSTHQSGLSQPPDAAMPLSAFVLGALVVIAMSAFAALSGLNGASLYVMLLAGYFLFLISVIDARIKLIPDELSLGLLWLGLLAASLHPLLNSWHVSTVESVRGAAVGYGSLWLLFHCHKLATGREGMGHGDFKLLAAIGAFVGAKLLPFVLVVAAVSGLLYALIGRISNRAALSETVPFGPFLSIGGWVVMVFGPEIMRAYIN